MKTVLILGIVVLLIAIIRMKSNDHSGLIPPDRPVWKAITLIDFSNIDTAISNSYLQYNPVHPKTLLWKVLTLDDSINNNQKTIR